MLEILFILCLLIWFPMLLFQMKERGLVLLVIWVFVAPVATNIIQNPDRQPFITVFYETDATGTQIAIKKPKHAEFTGSSTIKGKDLLEPTRILLGIFVILFFLGAILQKIRLGPLYRTEIWMIAFSLIMIASAFLRSKYLAFSLHTTLDAFITPFVAYFVASRLVTSEDRFRQLTRSIGYMSGYIIVICVIERLTNSELMYHLRGPFPNWQILHVVVAVGFFTVLLDWVCKRTVPNEETALQNNLRRFVMCLAPVVIFLTMKRGNWVGFLLSVGVFLFLGQRLTNASRKLRAIGLALMLVPMIAISVSSLPNQLIENRVSNVGNVYTRIAAWGILVRETYKGPILGIGLNNSRDVLTRTKEKFRGVTSETSAHNAFLAILVEQGVVGLVVYLMLVGSIIRMGLRLYRTGTHSRDRWRGVTVIAIMVAYLTPALFDNTLYMVGLSHFYVYVFMGGIAGRYGWGRSIPGPYESPVHRPWIDTYVPVSAR